MCKRIIVKFYNHKKCVLIFNWYGLYNVDLYAIIYRLNIYINTKSNVIFINFH